MEGFHHSLKRMAHFAKIVYASDIICAKYLLFFWRSESFVDAKERRGLCLQPPVKTSDAGSVTSLPGRRYFTCVAEGPCLSGWVHLERTRGSLRPVPSNFTHAPGPFPSFAFSPFVFINHGCENGYMSCVPPSESPNLGCLGDCELLFHTVQTSPPPISLSLMHADVLAVTQT